MSLVARWRALHATLPDNWADARLVLRVRDESAARRAAALLAPANPGRRGTEIRFRCARGGDGPSPDLVLRLLGRLDAERMGGELELAGGAEAPAGEVAAGEPALAAQWDSALAVLPPDWSDVYAEIELTSSDYLDRGALLLAPVNPARHAGRLAFRFRCARTFGYGAAPAMVRRCLERLDEEGIRGEVRILRALVDTRPVATQGPVWYVEGRSV